MGGSTFPDLFTPRIPDAVFHPVSKKIVSLLLPHCKELRLLKPSPGKVDHGDIDIIVAAPKFKTGQELSKILQGLPSSRVINPVINHVAFPASQCSEIPGVKAWISTLTQKDDCFIQVDVHVCKLEQIEWITFETAYGDFWIIMRQMLKRLGLRFDNVGLWLQLQEIEKTMRVREPKMTSYLYLSNSPPAVLEFLGLAEAEFEQGWDTVDEMFQYISTTRIFSLTPFAPGELQNADKNNLKRRSVYQKWVHEYLPSLLEKKPDIKVCTLTQSTIEREAVEAFGVRERRDTMVMNRRQLLAAQDFQVRVLPSLPAMTKAQSKAFHGCLNQILFPSLSETPSRGLQFWMNDGSLDEARLSQYISQNWGALTRKVDDKIERNR